MTDPATPFAIGRVALTVHDLDAVGAFYERHLGLHRLEADGERARYGAGGRPLIELRRDPGARRRSPREAGLFHTAILLPSRADLAGWTAQAIAARAPIVGASDHGVSEAIYLVDPEGNGVEIYADRPASAWRRTASGLDMPSDPLDLDTLLADAAPWQGAPDGTVIGHVHLQVGAIPAAEAFYAGLLGLAVTCRYPGGSFFAADGYHHHLATNVWNSRGAGPRSYPATGLADFEIRLDPARRAEIADRAGLTADADGLALRDPWGTEIRLAPALTPVNIG
ncbi:MAG: VOC family protein [Amaricoccus sp.]